MAEQPNYYSIITADVRYNKDLKANEKLLFSEITALSNKHGYCTASNKYFSEVYGVSKVTINDWIRHLKELGFIKVVKVYKNKQIILRKIYPQSTKHIQENLTRGSKENLTTPSKENLGRGSKEKFSTPSKENLTVNNTSNNNTSNNKYMSSSGELNQNSNKNNAKKSSDEIPYERIINYLNRKTNSHFRATTKEYRKLIRGRFADGYVAEDFKRVIDNKCKEWAHTEMVAYLTPNTLFKPSTFDTYLNQKVINPKHKNKDYKPVSNWNEKRSAATQQTSTNMTDEEMNRIFKEFAGGSQ